MWHAKLPSHTLWQIPAPRSFSACLGGTTTLGDGFTQAEDKINKAPDGEGFCQSALTEKTTAFQQNEPQLPPTLAVPSLSCAAPLELDTENLILSVAQPFNQISLMC